MYKNLLLLSIFILALSAMPASLAAEPKSKSSDKKQELSLKKVTKTETAVVDKELEKKADELFENLMDNGRVILENMEFDFNKTNIKTQSEPTIKTIAHMLKKNSKLKVRVVSHIDNRGDLDTSIDLTTKRAEAIVNNLVNKHGISAERAIPNGLGHLAPIDSNQLSEGRINNRRIELIEM